jgi:hypothetical protein
MQRNLITPFSSEMARKLSLRRLDKHVDKSRQGLYRVRKLLISIGFCSIAHFSGNHRAVSLHPSFE